MEKYIVSKKHKTTNYLGASVVTASVLLSSPVILNADTTMSNPTVLPINVVETKEKEQNYTNSYKVNKYYNKKGHYSPKPYCSRFIIPLKLVFDRSVYPRF